MHRAHRKEEAIKGEGHNSLSPLYLLIFHLSLFFFHFLCYILIFQLDTQYLILDTIFKRVKRYDLQKIFLNFRVIIIILKE